MVMKRTLLFVFFFTMLSSIDKAQSWRRRPSRRQSCSPTHCQVTSWSPWSLCTAQQCGLAGSQSRTRSITTSPSCGGSFCPSLHEVQVCYGSTPVDCSYSAWSTWSACSQCGESQSRRRYIATIEQCGGTPCNNGSDLNQTRACKTQCLNQGNLENVDLCSCPPSSLESCCLFNGGWGVSPFI